MDGYIFKDIDNSEYSVLLPNLWQDHFKMFVLNEIMRQNESKALNRLREGKYTSQDICTLKDRLIEPHEENYPMDAHFFIQNNKVNTFNNKVYCIISGAKYSIKAHDSSMQLDLKYSTRID